MSDNSQLELVREAAKRPPYKQMVYINAGQLLAEINREHPLERTCTFSVSVDDEDPMPTCSACKYEADSDEILECTGGETVYRYGWCVGCGARVVN